ncbi:sugar ABC transporter substrate-binding protein [Agrobacterium tumefaciens]|uniref:sugar ABC transporter substrate-binding protein n=1 Tax=Agrobacterium tumefaciens TaxID=358 RepID=UPI0012B6DCB6|nr:substrate-binding domain-containing protein [Agrobacterium tumefaciens]MQB07986.1 sugar ABC transporter substrate-binding protein [Agrobacterium tumefaciens]
MKFKSIVAGVLLNFGLVTLVQADTVREEELGTAAAGVPVAMPHKTLGILQLNAQAEVAFRIAEGARIPAEILGWKVLVCDSLGDPSRMASCAESLLNQGVNAIVTVAIEPAPVMAQLRRAREAGVPWLTLGGGSTPSELITAQYAPMETEMSDLLDAYLIERLKERKGDTKAIVISTFSQVWAGKQRSDALYRDLKGTNIKVVDEHVSDLANQIADARQSVTSQLTAFPGVDALLGTANYTVPVMGQIVAQRFPGKQFLDRPLVVGYTDDLVNLDSIRQGQTDAIATMRLDAGSWVGIDQLAQYFARGIALNPNAYLDGKEVYGLNLREATLVTRENLPPEGQYVRPTDDFEAFFKAKWAREFGIGGVK